MFSQNTKTKKAKITVSKSYAILHPGLLRHLSRPITLWVVGDNYVQKDWAGSNSSPINHIYAAEAMKTGVRARRMSLLVICPSPWIQPTHITYMPYLQYHTVNSWWCYLYSPEGNYKSPCLTCKAGNKYVGVICLHIVMCQHILCLCLIITVPNNQWHPSPSPVINDIGKGIDLCLYQVLD